MGARRFVSPAHNHPTWCAHIGAQTLRDRRQSRVFVFGVRACVLSCTLSHVCHISLNPQPVCGRACAKRREQQADCRLRGGLRVAADCGSNWLCADCGFHFGCVVI
eukprot:10145952-Alexandrium_andersonii.AAC.1